MLPRNHQQVHTTEEDDAELQRERLERRRAARREYQRRRRANMRASQQERERSQQRIYRQQQRLDLDTAQRHRQQQQNTEQHRLARASLSQEEYQLQQQQNSEQHHLARANQDHEQRQDQLQARRQATRERLGPLFQRACKGYQQVQQHTLGPCNIICRHCGAISFIHEPTALLCCRNGKIRLQPLAEPQGILRDLFTGQHPRSRHFFEHIREFNSSFSFASLGANIVQQTGRGPYVFKVQGQVYHHQSSVLPSDNRPNAFAQLYILDAEAAGQQRTVTAGNRCDAELMQQLSQYLHHVNPHVQSYRMMHEILIQQQQQQGTQFQHEFHFLLRIEAPENLQRDVRRYNLPSTNQVAAIFQSVDGEIRQPRDIAIYPRHRPDLCLRIDSSCDLVDPFLYPLLMPMGDLGWSYQRDRLAQVTIRDYFAFRFACRPGQFSAIHYGRNLFQQFSVDAYCRVEEMRLKYLRLNQNQLRVDLYSGLLDYVQNQAAANTAQPGRVFILPSTYSGSPRNMQQRFQNAMALVARYGRPDLFITFTCNPKWPEILDLLLPGQTASDRPDVVSRVFNLKANKLLHEITTGMIFGQVMAYTYSIEFQKRGLPHMHLLVILDGRDKVFGDPEKVDNVVSAEFPPIREFPELHELVKQHMVHGPCGAANPSCPCMKPNRHGVIQCSKFFPKSYSDSTNVVLGAYPQYRRRIDSPTAIICGHQVNSQWVVPYNAYLLQRYSAHINIEICSNIQVIKYVYKYFFKGHDRAAVAIQVAGSQGIEQQMPDYDEITRYVDMRYVAAPEALWHIQSHSTAGSSHSVFVLALHLPHQQLVYFAPGEEDNAVQRVQKSSLLAWFDINAEEPADGLASTLSYVQFPEHYTFNKSTKKWTRRVRACKVIGRMPIVPMSYGEKWYLRLLLQHVKGAKCWDDLYSFRGVKHSTFRQAVVARGLLADDIEFEAALQEGAHCLMPRQLRNMFVTILVYGQPSNPLHLWNQFCEHMCQRLRPAEHAQDVCLLLIQRQLERFNLSLEQFGLPVPSRIGNLQHVEEDEFQEQAPQQQQPSIPVEQQIGSLLERLNPEQAQIVQHVLAAIASGQGACIYMDGPGGTGKTFVYNTLSSILSLRGRPSVNVASTGIAATLLHKGSTAHSRFKIPLDLSESATCSIVGQSMAATQIRQAPLIIWDEAPMSHRFAIEAVDRLLRDLRGQNQPFGGIVVLLGGDFRQTLPVVRGGTNMDSIAASITQSSLWPLFQVFRLQTNMRAGPGEHAFADWLLQVGNGTANTGPGTMQINLHQPHGVKTMTQLIDEVFGTSISPEDTQHQHKAILCPHNEYSRAINNLILQRVQGGLHSFLSADAPVDEAEAPDAIFPVEFLNTLQPTGMPPHNLQLKVGVLVVLLRNLNVNEGLCNGTRLQVVSIGQHILLAKVLVGAKAGELVMIPRVSLNSPQDDPTIPQAFSRRQFPLQLGYGMTINKAQGQTLDRVGVFLEAPVFAHGQLYVALSRCRSLSAITVQLPRFPDCMTKNVVFPDALSPRSVNLS